MHHRQVVALEIVVDVHLPVAGDVPLLPRHVAHLLAAEGRDAGRHVLEHVEQRRRLAVEVGEDERAPRGDLHRYEMHLRGVEPLDTLHLRRADQGAVETVGPAVVAALQGVALPASLGDGAGAVQAHVVECAQRVVIAEHDDGIVADGGGEVLAVLRHLLAATDELPGVREDPLALQLQIHRIVVEPRRDGGGARDVRIEREDEGHAPSYARRVDPQPAHRRPRGGAKARDERPRGRLPGVEAGPPSPPQGSATNCPRKARASSVSVR